MTAAKPSEIISDAEIIRVHANANFGAMSPREVVDDGVRKTAVGYHCGHTQFTILREHGLITRPRGTSYDANLTKKGKRYARALAWATGWRCFHCDETFTSEWRARQHFGATEDASPACKVSGSDGGLLEAMRRAEASAAEAWGLIHSESTETAKSYAALVGRHAEQNRAAEQAGYDRGIADAKAHSEAIALNADARPSRPDLVEVVEALVAGATGMLRATDFDDNEPWVVSAQNAVRAGKAAVLAERGGK